MKLGELAKLQAGVGNKVDDMQVWLPHLGRLLPRAFNQLLDLLQATNLLFDELDKELSVYLHIWAVARLENIAVIKHFLSAPVHQMQEFRPHHEHFVFEAERQYLVNLLGNVCVLKLAQDTVLNQEGIVVPLYVLLDLL